MRGQLLERHRGSIEAIEKILMEGKNFKPLTKDRKSNIATLLENFQSDLRAKGNMQMGAVPGTIKSVELMEGRALLENSTMQGAVAGANAGTGLAQTGPFTKFGINLITAVMTQVVADTLVSVQPMTNRVGEVRYLKYKYGSAKSPTKKGDLVSSALEFQGGNFEYSSETVTGEVQVGSKANTPTMNLAWTPVRPTFVEIKAIKTAGDAEELYIDDGTGKIVKKSDKSNAGTIDYVTGEIKMTGDFSSLYKQDLEVTYEYANTEVSPEVPVIESEIAIMPMIAKSRKLKTLYSFDAAFDMQGDYGFDIDSEIVAYFSAEIAHEIDGEIITDLRNMALSNTDKITEFNTVPPTGVSQMDHDDAFWNKIVEGGNLIFKRMKRGKYSWIVAGINVCSTLETMRQFVPSNIDAVGPHVCGTIKGVPVIKNPFLGDNEYVVGYKGAQLFDAGYIYAPYMPVTVIDVMMPDGFTFGKGFATAYGKAKLNANCYAYGSIKSAARA